MAHALLTQIENRGTHASGFAYVGKDGSFGVYKQPKPGSQLSLAELPRDAKTVILHTRFATQGSTHDNRNNHPVMSTDNKIALVHNGVISNDYGLRSQLGIEARHGEVDSLVIPSLISQQGVEGLGKMAGYAAVAWLNAEQNGELHIARLKSSPVAYTHLIDGTFVMASTPALLTDALDSVNAFYGGVFEMKETTLMSVHRGFIYNNGASPSMSYSHSTYTRYSGATSGGHGSTSTTTSTKGSEDTRAAVFSETGESSCEVDISRFESELDEWRRKRAEDDLKIANQAINRMIDESGEEIVPDDGRSPGEWDADEWDAYVARMEGEESFPGVTGYDYGEGFYIVDSEGDISHHASMEGLEQRLHWLSQMQAGEWDLFQDLTEDMRWVNQITDIGLVLADGTLESWVKDDETTIDNYESPAVRNLQYIRDGVGLLQRLIGA